MKNKITLNYLKDRYLEHLKELNYSEYSLESYSKAIDKYIEYLQIIRKKSNIIVKEITKDNIRKYWDYIIEYRTTRGKELTGWSRNTLLQGLKNYLNYLKKQGYILFNPMEGMRIKKPEREMQDKIISEKEMSCIISIFDTTTVIGLRDRSMIELLYSTGIRKSELVNLNIYDIDYENGYIRINQGKGKKDRIIPIGKRACEWVKKYLNRSRPVLLKEHGDKGLFVNLQGRRITKVGLQRMMRTYMMKLGYTYRTHCFRHTFATSLLKGGADIRYVQAMLGHEDIGSTEIYTKVVVEDLRESLKKHHPRSKKYKAKY